MAKQQLNFGQIGRAALAGSDADQSKRRRGGLSVPFRRMVLLILAAQLFAPAALAVDFDLESQVLLTDIDANTNDGRLGRAVAIGDDLVVMGAPFRPGSGEAYLYRINDDRDLQFVLEFNPQNPFRYGAQTAISGDLLAIGNDFNDEPIELFERAGAGYIFSTLIPKPELSGITIRGWGSVLDLEGDRLIVGDASANVDGVGNAGAVIIFRRDIGGPNNWGVEGVLLDTAPGIPNRFGRAVAVGDNVAVVGDEGSERALLFQRSGDSWSFSRLLAPVNPEDGDDFGSAVAAEGDVVAVGARNGNNAVTPTNSGSVHLFQRNQGGANQFGQIAEVVGSEADFIDDFGESLSLREGILAVGSPGGNRAYLFRVKDGVWQEETVVQPPNVPFGNVNFGFSVDYWRGSLVVGAESWDDAGAGRFGAVFLYENELVRLCGGKFDAIFCDTFEAR